MRPRYNISLELNIDIARFYVSIAVPFGVACWAAWQEMESACALYTRSCVQSVLQTHQWEKYVGSFPEHEEKGGNILLNKWASVLGTRFG